MVKCSSCGKNVPEDEYDFDMDECTDCANQTVKELDDEEDADC